MSTPYHADTIAALATAPGQGGVGIIRVSGPAARSIAQQIARREPRPRYAHYGPFFSGEQTLDEGITLFFPGPHSFTGEDVLELQGHGGPVVMDLLLKACLAAGARQARPGEFSERAFLNDKLDLAQAEAIADLIESSSEQAARCAVRSMQGVFSKRVDNLVEAITHLRIYVEAAIDFPEEEIDFLADGKVATDLQNLLEQVEQILGEAQQGTILRDGMKVVIAGRPNAGKSSLLNALLQEDRAIVTPIAGTTRDTLEERTRIKDIHIVIIDSAGLRAKPELIEKKGIERTRSALEKADLALVIFDTSQPLDDNDKLLMHEVGEKPKLVVLNKSDLPASWQPDKIKDFLANEKPLTLSAKTLNGFDSLKEALYQKAIGGERVGESLIITRERHRDHLHQAAHALQNAGKSLSEGYSEELVAVDVTLAMEHLGIILGKTFEEDLLDKIFGQFCIGK